MSEDQNPVSEAEEREALDHFKDPGPFEADRHGRVLARALRQAREKLAEETAARKRAEEEVKRLSEGWCATCYPSRLKYEARAEAAESRALAAEKELKVLRDGFDASCQSEDDLRGIIRAKDALLARAREAMEESNKAIATFFHHWEHGGIARDNPFHQQTAYQLRSAKQFNDKALAQLPVTPAPTQEVIYVCIKCGDKKPFVGSAPAPEKCVCGDWTKPGIVHRDDGPCYHVPAPVGEKRPCANCGMTARDHTLGVGNHCNHYRAPVESKTETKQ